MKKKLFISFLVFSTVLIIGFIGAFFIFRGELRASDSSSEETIIFNIESGTPTSVIIKNLKIDNLIRNEMALKIYSKIHPGVPKAGRYEFKKSMSAISIYRDIINGNVSNQTTWITFVEGKRLSYIAEQISNKFDISKEEVENLMDNREFIASLIAKYDVLTEEILAEGIYHPLEGYLFPDTYEFLSDASVENIIEKMVATLDARISGYKTEIAESGKSIHEILTLASIVELEGAHSDDRSGIAGVFANRLKNGGTLGSDVTTYYAVGKDFSVDLTWTDLNSCNGYNTRGNCVKGLPIGPIASPGIESIIAAIHPAEHDYYYFVADKNGKTYFSKNDTEHRNTVDDLKAKGLWYVYN